MSGVFLLGDAVAVLFSPMTKTWYWYPRLPLTDIVRSDPNHPFSGNKLYTNMPKLANSKCEYQTDPFGLAASKKLRIKYTNKHRL